MCPRTCIQTIFFDIKGYLEASVFEISRGGLLRGRGGGRDFCNQINHCINNKDLDKKKFRYKVDYCSNFVNMM